MALTRALYGVTLTLADANAHNLYDLLSAIEVDLLSIYQNCSYLRIQADLANAANAVYIGDLNVSATRMSYALLAHDQVPYESPASMVNVPLKDIWVMAAAATCLINVEVIFV